MPYSVNLFRKNIRTLRKKRKLTQAEVGEGLGEQSTISKYETGASSISLDLAIKYAEYYGIPLENLCTHDYSISDRPYADLSIRDPNSSEEARRLFRDRLFFIYYLSAAGSINEGIIDFDSEFDMKRKFLHGEAITKNRYDCKLVIEGKESVYVYGTEYSESWRFMIMFPYPKGTGEYPGGTGILVHKDEGDNLVGQKVVISEKKLDAGENSPDHQYLMNWLQGRSCTDRNEDIIVKTFIKTDKKRMMTEEALKQVAFRNVMGNEIDDKDFPYDTAHAFLVNGSHLFAEVLSERFGYEAVQIADGEYCHWLCRSNGKYIDALGVCDHVPTYVHSMKMVEENKHTEAGLAFAHRFVKMYRDVYELER